MGMPRQPLLNALALSLSLAMQDHPRGPGPDHNFSHLAEGRTSVARRLTIEAGYRMFSAPDFAAVCAAARATEVKQLHIRPLARLRVGRVFDPKMLTVVARD